MSRREAAPDLATTSTLITSFLKKVHRRGWTSCTKRTFATQDENLHKRKIIGKFAILPGKAEQDEKLHRRMTQTTFTNKLGMAIW